MSDSAAIAQDYLDRMSAAVLAGDWITYETGVALPFCFVTAEAQIIVSTQAELRQGFDSFQGYLASQAITDLARLVSHAVRLEPTLISANYVTHMMSRATRVVPPFASHMVLRQRDGVWRCAVITNGMKSRRWPIHTVAVTEDRAL
jgi:hypothetical protein